MKHIITKTQFKAIPGFQGYWIDKLSTDVLCTNQTPPVILKQIPNSKGTNNYLLVVINSKNEFIHRLMAKTFLPREKEYVNHIDGNKQNNQLTNLEWVTPKENVHHAIRTGLTDITINRKVVHQYTLGGLYINSYSSDKLAYESTGIQAQNISKVSVGGRIQAGGFQWRRYFKPVIPPVDIKILKGIKVTYHDGTTTFVNKVRQSVAIPLSDLLEIPTNTIINKLEKTKGVIIFIKDIKLEKVYFD